MFVGVSEASAEDEDAFRRNPYVSGSSWIAPAPPRVTPAPRRVTPAMPIVRQAWLHEQMDSTGVQPSYEPQFSNAQAVGIAALNPPIINSDGAPLRELPGKAEDGITDESTGFTVERDLQSMLIPLETNVYDVLEKRLSEQVGYNFLAESQPVMIDQADALFTTLNRSYRAQLQAFAVVESRTQILERAGQFDWLTFLQQSWNNQKSPNQAPLGGTGVGQGLIDQRNVDTQFGARRQNQIGGEFSATQSFQKFDRRETSLSSQEQLSSQTALRYQQQLLRDSGRQSVTALLRIAQFEAGQEQQRAISEIATLMVDVTEAYWLIAQQRASLLALDSAIQTVQQLSDVLADRAGLDAAPYIRSRSRLSVANLKNQYQQTLLELRRQQIEFVRLVGTTLSSQQSAEFIPQMTALKPADQPLDANLQISQAIATRPEILERFLAVEANSTELSFSRNQLLPRLATFFQLQLEGLTESSSVFPTLNQSRSFDFPTTEFGLEFELPVSNRVARANNRRALAEYRRSLVEMQVQIADVVAEVLTVVADYNSLQQQLALTREGIFHSLEGIKAIEVERTTLPPEDSNPTFALNTLVDQIELLTNSQLQWFSFYAQLQINEIRLQQATGTLVSRGDFNELVAAIEVRVIGESDIDARCQIASATADPSVSEHGVALDQSARTQPQIETVGYESGPGVSMSSNHSYLPDGFHLMNEHVVVEAIPQAPPRWSRFNNESSGSMTSMVETPVLGASEGLLEANNQPSNSHKPSLLGALRH